MYIWHRNPEEVSNHSVELEKRLQEAEILESSSGYGLALNRQSQRDKSANQR
jgi:hypothetical protein